MATTLYFRDAFSDFNHGEDKANLQTVNVTWFSKSLSTSPGSGVVAKSTNTVAGPTAGIDVRDLNDHVEWISPPLSADVTISGSVTWNLWAAESNMSANVAINGRLEVIDPVTGTVTLIDQTARTTEVAVTTRAVNNFSETPAAGVACKKGDRLRIRVLADDAGTMASGHTFSFGYDGGTASADGDSFVTLTETIAFASEPAGTQIFLTDTASAVSTAAVDREAWTSRGAGVQSDVTNTVSGWTSPVQTTDTAGGTVVDWWTRPLTAFTIGGAIRCNTRVLASVGSGTSFAQVRVEVAVTEGDGSSPVTVAAGCPATFIDLTTEVAFSFLASGDDVAVSTGQRLRIRLLLDDLASAMSSAKTVTTFYAGTSGGASGDTYLTFSQTLTESAGAKAPPFRHRNRLIIR